MFTLLDAKGIVSITKTYLSNSSALVKKMEELKFTNNLAVKFVLYIFLVKIDCKFHFISLQIKRLEYVKNVELVKMLCDIINFLLRKGNLSKLTPRKFLSVSLENKVQIPFNPL